MKAVEIPRSVYLLAQFANLTEKDVGDFRALSQAEDFAPDSWWAASAFLIKKDAPSMPLWRVEQKRLRDAWRLHFPPDTWLSLILSSAKYSQQEEFMRNASEQMLAMGNDEAFEFAAKAKVPATRVYSFYQAVVFVAHEAWVAKVCGWPSCSKFFVADHNARTYCSSQCSAEGIRRNKQKSRALHDHEWRPRVKKNKKKTGGR